MGEEEKKVEEANKPEEENKERQKIVESKESKELPPPDEIVLRVYMHCEGCARKVRRSLKGFEGVEDVKIDCETHKVIVKGKNADPLKVWDRVQRKSHIQVELLSAIKKPPVEAEKKREGNNENLKKEESKEEGIIVVLMIQLHCEACAQEIQKRIQGIKGVQAAVTDLKSSKITVKCVIDPPKLLEYVYKRTGKHAVIVKTEPEKKEEKNKTEKEEKKGENSEKDKRGGEGEKKVVAAKPAEEEATKAVELKKNEFYYNPPKYNMEYIYPPQFFSDENPNACSVM